MWKCSAKHWKCFVGKGAIGITRVILRKESEYYYVKFGWWVLRMPVPSQWDVDLMPNKIFLKSYWPVCLIYFIYKFQTLPTLKIISYFEFKYLIFLIGILNIPSHCQSLTFIKYLQTKKYEYGQWS